MTRTMNIDDCRALVVKEMAKVDQVITTRLQSDVVLINQMAGYIINSGGKRLRPQLVLWAARACGYTGEKHILLAAIIEFIHTATLLHDDVVDASELRRGAETANTVWGNEAAVLVGDFLYSRSFEMMVDVNDMRVMRILAGTTNRIAEGEVMQLMNIHDPKVTEEDYVTVIQAKTARLFEASTQLGAVVAGVEQPIEQGLAAFGRHLGTAFQIADDVLDYSSDSASIGKEIGDDLAEGKPTLPLILAMRSGNEQQQQLIANAIEHGGREMMDEVMAVVQSTGAIEGSLQRANLEADRAIEALSVLPDNEHRAALEALANFSVSRLS